MYVENCPLCSHPQCKILREVTGHKVFQCQHCDFIFIPGPDGKAAGIYDDNYFDNSNKDYGYENYEKEFDTHYRAFSERIADTEKILGRKGRLLDVGCALGHCGKAADDRGWDVFVTDISAYSAQAAKRKFDLKSFISPANVIPIKDKTFDCITLFDVIEHLQDPWPLLKEVRRCLSESGIFHLTTPDVSSWSAKLMGSKWYHYKPNEHLSYFSPETLRKTLEKAGFEVIKIRPMPMHMKLRDIFLRLKRYWNFGASVAIKILDLVGLSDFILRFYAGEMEAWARPRGGGHSNSPVLEKVPLEEIVCCPECRHDLVVENSGFSCSECNSSFSFNSDVIDFSGHGKKEHQVRKTAA